MGKFKKVFRRLPDPRADNARHDLLEILVIALAAIAVRGRRPLGHGAFGRSKERLLRQFLRLEYGIPSHDTFSRVFRSLDPQAFEEAFRQFMAAFAKANGIDLTGVIAIDGKALRGAYERGQALRRCIWSMSLRPKPGWRLASRKAPGRNEAAGALGGAANAARSKAASLPPMRCIAIAALPQRCSSAAAITRWRSRKIRANCSLPSAGALPAPASAALPNSANRPPTIAANRGAPPSFATPAWLPQTDFPGIVALGRITSRRRLQGRPRREAGRALLPAFQIHPRQAVAARSCAVIGASRTGCIGCSMSSSTRMATEPERTTPPRTSPSCEGSLSISFAPTQPAYPCARKVKRAGWDDAFLLGMLSHMR